MANTVQIKRGGNASVNAHTGPSGELIYNLDTGRIHAQDGSTAGGKPHALISDVDLKANAATQVIAGDGLTGGGTLADNRTLALSSTSIASLSLADSAVQSVNGKSGSAVSLVKSDVGLGNVDNTSDLAKPISTLTQTALNAKANSAITVSAGTGLTGGGNLTANRTVALNAASIASLGKADTALQALGGTAGQILAKNSGADNDVLWVSSEAATAVSYGPQTLTEAQQGQARANMDAGILAGFRNKIINGNFDVWQRGFNLPSGTGARILPDMWYLSSRGSLISASRVEAPTGGTAMGVDTAFFVSCSVTTVAGADNYGALQQRMEGVRFLSGKKVTITFYAKADSAKNIAVELEQNFGTGGGASPAVTGIASQKVSLTAQWKRYSLVVDLPSIEGKIYGTAGSNFLGLTFWFDAGENYNSRSDSLGRQSGVFDVAKVSIVEGDASKEADPFSPRHIQQELALCQRYFEIVSGGYSGPVTSGNGYWGFGYPRVQKRATPTVSWYRAQTVFRFPNSAPIIENVMPDGGISFRMSATGTGDGAYAVHSFFLDAEL